MKHNSGELLRILKRLSLVAGILLAIFSIYFSWDGLDQTVTGNNPAYTDFAKIIGGVFAVVITLLQFIFNTDFKNLNTTMRVMGAASYIYSIYTNFLGIQHIFGFSDFTAWSAAGIMDVLPEAFIAWSLGEHMEGDMLGNLTKFILGTKDEPVRENRHQEKQYTFTPSKPSEQGQGKKHKGSERRRFLEENHPNKKGEDVFNKFFGE